MAFTHALHDNREMKKNTDKTNNSLSWLKQGTELQENSDMEGAIAKAIRIDPDLAGLYVMRGYAYTKTGRLRQAMRDANKATKLDPEMTEPYFIRGVLYGERGKYKEAIAEFTTSLKLDPKYAKVYFMRAAVYTMKGEGVLALLDYQMAALLGDKRTQDFLRRQGIGWLVGGTESGSMSKN